MQPKPACPEYNHSITDPGTARSRSCNFTHGLHRPASDLDFFELDARKEGDRTAVGRPERIAGAFGSRQRLCRETIECSHPELVFTTCSGGEGQPAAIRRNGKRAQAGLLGWQNGKPHGVYIRRSFAEMRKG